MLGEVSEGSWHNFRVQRDLRRHCWSSFAAMSPVLVQVDFAAVAKRVGNPAAVEPEVWQFDLCLPSRLLDKFSE